MTIRNLDYSLAPRSVAVIGASERPGSVGRVVIENIVNGGFTGAVYPVNLKYDQVLGRQCYKRIADLPEAPDLAVIMTPPATVPSLVGELGARGAKLVVVITAGVGAADDLRQKMLDAAQPHLLRIIGPNTIGLLAPLESLNASFAHIPARPGRLGLISQSGAIVSSVIDWAEAEGIGFSHVFSLGDMADVDVGDCLNILAQDDATDAILMYLESVTAPRKFMSAARAASRVKPVIAVKPGRHAEAAQAAKTHTGALAGVDRVVDAALRRAGIIRVDDLADLFEAAEVTGRFRPIDSGRVAIVTNGGGAGVLAVDQLLDRNCQLARLSEATMAGLNAALPETWSHANPVDIIGDAPPERYRAAVEAVAADAGVDAILVMNCPTALADPSDAARGVASLVDRGRLNGKPVLTCWLGKKAAEPARAILQNAGIAGFETPAQAAEAVELLTHWSDLRRTLERVPPSRPVTPVDRNTVELTIAAAAAEGRTILTEPEAKTVVAAYGVPAPRTLVAKDEGEVERLAAEMLLASDAVVVKLFSKTVSHKSDVGGVALNLRDAAAARQAAAAMRQRLVAAGQEGILDGFTVQPMIRRSEGQELIVGISSDPIFGPIVLFGAGGTSVEVVDDTATGLVPLDAVLAGDLIDRTRISKLLAGYRDRPPANRDAIIATLLALSQLAVDVPAIRSIDINPLVADAAGVMALDVRVEIDPAQLGVEGPNPRLSIRPYPAGEERRIELSGQRYDLRPIRPEDASLYPEFLSRMVPDDMHLRFLVPMPAIPPQLLIRLTQLDYDREIAFVALEPDSGALAGVVRYAADPDRETAEFGVLARSDLKGHGLGWAMMQRIIEYAKSEGIGALVGLVLRGNDRMLTLCRELGFSFSDVPGDASLVRARLELR